jgi:hypothetical protein
MRNKRSELHHSAKHSGLKSRKVVKRRSSATDELITACDKALNTAYRELFPVLRRMKPSDIAARLADHLKTHTLAELIFLKSGRNDGFVDSESPLRAMRHEFKTGRVTRTRQEQRLYDAAKAQFEDEGTLEIDDNAEVSASDDGGAYVAAWVYVEADRSKDDSEDEQLSTPCGSMTHDQLRKHVKKCAICANEFAGEL